jgi:hypothetical protein
VTRALACFSKSHQRYLDQPVAATLSRYRQAKPGSLALHWLLHSDNTCELNQWEHSRLLKLISHCLVAEGNLDILTAWVLAKDAPTQSLSTVSLQPDFWRGQILSYTMQAQAYWTQHPLLLEESMQTYLVTTRRAIRHVYVSHSLPATWLLQILSLTAATCVEGSSYDYFRSLMPFWQKNQQDLDFKQAEMSFMHPTQPGPLPALLWLQKHANSDWDQQPTRHIDPAGRDSSARGWLFFVRTAQLLASSSRHEDAKWVLDIGRDSLPLRFAMRRPRGKLSTTTPRRLATPDEVVAGMADINGYLLSTKKRTSVYTMDPARSTSPSHRTHTLGPPPLDHWISPRKFASSRSNPVNIIPDLPPCETLLFGYQESPSPLVLYPFPT